MEKRISEWHYEIDSNTELFERKFGGLTEDVINWKPDAGTWSIGQVIEHLIKTNKAYFKIPEQIKGKDYRPSILSKIGIIPLITGRILLKAVDPETKRKVRTMNVFEPDSSNVPADIISYFNESQADLHKFVDDNKNFILKRIVIPSPVNRHIVYYFDTVIDILINHQKRHFRQAEDIMNLYRGKR
jgi:hypothetical protein